MIVSHGVSAFVPMTRSSGDMRGVTLLGAAATDSGLEGKSEKQSNNHKDDMKEDVNGSTPQWDAKDISEARKKLLRDEENNLPPVLQNMVAERREFELSLGRAMDTLRRDYPELLRREPNFDIFTNDIKVVDPSGVQISGLSKYKSSFKFLQTFIGLFYNKEKSMVQHRMVYDWARSSIRISWNVVLVPKVVGNVKNSLYIDGISIYKMNIVASRPGDVSEHKVEKLMINNIPVEPPYGIFSTLREEMMDPARVPVGVGAMFNLLTMDPNVL